MTTSWQNPPSRTEAETVGVMEPSIYYNVVMIGTSHQPLLYPLGSAQTQDMGLHKGINTKKPRLLFILGSVWHNDLDVFKVYFVDYSSVWVWYSIMFIIQFIFFQNITDMILNCSHCVWWLMISVCLFIYVHFVAQLVKNPPVMQETWVQSLGWEDPLENGKAIHFSILPGEFHGLYGPWSHTESDTTERLFFFYHSG